MLDNITTGLYPNPTRNGIMKFVHPDDEDSYKKNLEKFGPTWYYANKNIEYIYNSLGYRTKELEYYKDKDFILVMGCSHTEGIGLAEEEIWHTQLTKEFGYEILNAGCGGVGTDLQMINTLLFLENTQLKPKAVIMQWPNFSRILFKGTTLQRGLVPNLKMRLEGPDGDSLWDKFKREQRFLESFYKWWLYDNNDVNNSWIFIECTRMIWKLTNIPYYDFSIEPDPLYANHSRIDNFYYKIESKDFARDQNHYGIDFNKELGQLVNNELRKIL